jgi:hypothetical protein
MGVLKLDLNIFSFPLLLNSTEGRQCVRSAADAAAAQDTCVLVLTMPMDAHAGPGMLCWFRSLLCLTSMCVRL